MGLILDTNILIAAERRSEAVEDILHRAKIQYGMTDVGISTISVVELTHGIYRAGTGAARVKRRLFTEQAFRALLIHPVNFEIAQLAGRIEGEQAALGNTIAFEDLMIGATALHLGYAVATRNVKHFQRIPNLLLATI